MKPILYFVLGCVSAVVASLFILGAVFWTPAAPAFDDVAARNIAATYDARVIRDGYGVPHIFGKTDADASFGFGYAHAEDDWETIQDTLLAARGVSAQYQGKEAAPRDYLQDLFKVTEFVDRRFEAEVSPEAKAIAKAYADAMNLFGAEYPDRVLPGVLPVTDKDILAGFTWATPFFYRMDEYLADLFTAEDRPDVSPYSQTAQLPMSVRGSNAFAVAPSRSADGHTRLIVNSHQPMTGPYAWYEAHLVSEEGLNTAGATFPGVPIMAQGVTPNLGWTHTVNRPDLVDIYALDVDNPKKPRQYKLDGEWRDFEVTQSKFRVKLWGPFSLPVTRDVLWSEHGPVLSPPHGHYAIRFAGMGNMTALDQWYAMNKATNMQQWRDAVAINGVLSFNIVYGDKEGNIGTIYNAKMPRRIEGPAWDSVLPGDQSVLIWDDFKSTSELPQIWNPDCGWLFSANATPFALTDPACDNQRSDFSETMGIERRMTNRARRAISLFTADDSITREELLQYRADTKYDPESDLMRLVVELVGTPSDDALVKQAQEILRNWNGDTTRDNRQAALAVITGMRAKGYEFLDDEEPPLEVLKRTAEDIIAAYGRIDPEWGTLNRLQRGDIDVALDGAPDVLRAIYADRDGVSKTGVMNAFAGDTHIMVADWNPAGDLDLVTIHNYGSATLDKMSPHYADQVELFAAGGYKPMPMTLEQVLPLATRDYRPGQKTD